MILPDANLLIYAHDASSPLHAQASVWCREVMTGLAPVVLLPVVVFGFVRISTHPRIFTHPLTVDEAAEAVRSWLDRPQVRVVDMLAEDVAAALDLLRKAGTAANLTSDAQLAAVALRLDAEVHTADLDFGRFRGVRFRNPLLD